VSVAAKVSLEAAKLKCDQLARELGISVSNHTFSKLRMFIIDAIGELSDAEPKKRQDLTEVTAEYIKTNGGTTVRRVFHHTGCALDVGRGACNCDPIRSSDLHTPREVR
jgi:hypothetical protein